MKKLGTYIILGIYLNMAFINHIKEVNAFGSSINSPIDEINTFCELVLAAMNVDQTADDEEGDTGTEDDGTVVSSLTLSLFHVVIDNNFLSNYHFCGKTRFLHFWINRFNRSRFLSRLDSPPPEV
jgi:hypothetical protein